MWLFGILQAEAESREAEQMKKKLTKKDESSLSSLILRNQQTRKQEMDAFFTDLANKYGRQDKESNAASKTATVTKKSTSKPTKRTVAKAQTKSKGKKRWTSVEQAYVL